MNDRDLFISDQVLPLVPPHSIYHGAAAPLFIVGSRSRVAYTASSPR